MTTKRDNYISLKDAAKVSGYSADYIGQLIREGKLEGKQVYSGVSWLTTEQAIREYISKKKNILQGRKSSSEQITRKATHSSALFFYKLSAPSAYVFVIFMLGVITSFFYFAYFLLKST